MPPKYENAMYFLNDFYISRYINYYSMHKTFAGCLLILSYYNKYYRFALALSLYLLDALFRVDILTK